MRTISILSAIVVVATAAIACSNADDKTDGDSTGQGALRADVAEDVDEGIVGTWVDANGEQLLVHTLELRADGTFHAQGGCRVDDGGTRRCYSVQEANGRWSVGRATQRAALPITLRDSKGKAFNYNYTPGRLAGLGNDALIIKDGEKKATFKRLAANVIAPGGVCEIGGACSEGFECKSNCPAHALCIVNIDTCQPKARIQRGGICTLSDGQPSECAEGLVCKDNCPQGAMCFVSIFTCQPG